jgi:DNA polymerase-3 subunit beta
MKLTVSRKHFAAALKASLPAVPTRPGIPVLTGVRLQAEDDALTLETTDLELAIRRKVEGEVSLEEPGSVLMPAKPLGKAVEAMGEDHLELTSAAEDGRLRLHVTAGNRTVVLQALPEDEWPAIQPLSEATTVARAGTADLADAFGRAALCASTDEMRPILTGVALFFEEGSASVEVVATDSYRMGAVRVPLAEEPRVPERPPLVPGRIAKALARQLKKAEGEVEILSLDSPEGREPRVAFAFSGAVWTVRTIEGEFPNWRQVMPSPEGGLLEADSSELTSALKAAASVRTSKEAPVRLSLEESCFLMLTEPDAGTLIEELADARFSPDGVGAIEVSFNPTYLLDGVRFTGEERTRMWVRDGLKPALMEGPDRRYAVMPIRQR